MIYFLILFIVLIFLLLMANAYVFSKRAGKMIGYYFSCTIENIRSDLDKKNDVIRLMFSFVFLFSPLMLYKSLKESTIENYSIGLFLLVFIFIISAFCLWFSIVKFGSKDFGFKNVNPTTLINYLKPDIKEKISLIEKRLETIKKEKIINSHILNFENFIELVTKHKYFEYATFQFEYTKFEFENSRLPNQRWGYFVLIVMYHEEVIKKKGYISRLNHDYFEPLNKRILQKDDILKGPNWSSFRKVHIKEGGLEYLKETKFYCSLLEFYKKNI